MSSFEGEKMLKGLLKIIDDLIKEIFGQDQSTSVWSIDYGKLDKVEISKESTLSIVDGLISKLQTLQSNCKTETICDVSEQPWKKIKIEQDVQSKTSVPTKEIQEGINPHQDIDWTLVQVKADKSEIDRRISAFIQQKQNEVDLVNRREFCNIIDSVQENVSSCARTDAIFVPRFGQKSHIKVTRVGNTSTSDEAEALSHVTDNTRLSIRPKKSCTEPSVTERLHNIEHHIGFTPGKPVAPDIYKHIKDLESRILQLESLSPEYFNKNVSQASRPSANDSSSLEEMSLRAIDERIAALKKSLLSRSR